MSLKIKKEHPFPSCISDFVAATCSSVQEKRPVGSRMLATGHLHGGRSIAQTQRRKMTRVRVLRARVVRIRGFYAGS